MGIRIALRGALHYTVHIMSRYLALEEQNGTLMRVKVSGIRGDFVV